MLVTSVIFVSIIAGVSLIASATTAICLLFTKRDGLSVALGTVTVPALICASIVYWVNTMDADDPAPGNVLIGNLFVLAIVTPIAFLASHLTIRFLDRRALRNDR